MIGAILNKYRRWNHKRLTWAKYGNHTRYHLVGDRYNIGDYTHGVPVIHAYDENTKLTIGKYCSIAAGTQIVLGGNHHIEWTSTYAFYQEVEHFPKWNDINNNSRHRGDVIIGNDVWIGRNALILSGAEIGDGAVIGAGAVVAGKVPPYSIAVGNPARVIRQRFAPPICEKLLNIKWWNWDEERINRYLPLICSIEIENFISAVENEELADHQEQAL